MRTSLLAETKMNLIEISEREVLAKAKAWRQEMIVGSFDLSPAESALLAAVVLLEERERMAGQGDVLRKNTDTPITVNSPDMTIKHTAEPLPDSGASSRDENEATASAPIGGDDCDVALDIPPPRPGADPITRPPRKLSRREREIERRRASDPLGRDRPEIDYGDDSLPTVR